MSARIYYAREVIEKLLAVMDALVWSSSRGPDREEWVRAMELFVEVRDQAKDWLKVNE